MFDEFKYVLLLVLYVKGFVKYILCKKVIRIYYLIFFWYVIFNVVCKLN